MKELFDLWNKCNEQSKTHNTDLILYQTDCTGRILIEFASFLSTEFVAYGALPLSYKPFTIKTTFNTCCLSLLTQAETQIHLEKGRTWLQD